MNQIRQEIKNILTDEEKNYLGSIEICTSYTFRDYLTASEFHRKKTVEFQGTEKHVTFAHVHTETGNWKIIVSETLVKQQSDVVK